MRILIVEDENVSRKKMQIIMDNFGITDTVADGRGAINLFTKAWQQRAPFDLICLDITLPEITGIDVLLKIREEEDKMELPPTKRVKVMMVTAHSDRDHINTCVTAGCDGYIVKPYAKDTVVRCLQKIYTKYINEVLTAD